MNDLFGQPVLDPVKVFGKLSGYARRPGTGPDKETCGSCAHCCATGNGRKTYYKCDVIRWRWTHGYGTDILKSSPACELWKPKT